MGSAEPLEPLLTKPLVRTLLLGSGNGTAFGFRDVVSVGFRSVEGRGNASGRISDILDGTGDESGRISGILDRTSDESGRISCIGNGSGSSMLFSSHASCGCGRSELPPVAEV